MGINPSRVRKVKIDIDGKPIGKVSISIAKPVRSRATAIIAHGAGGTMSTPSIVALQKGLVRQGVSAVRFNFHYSEIGKTSPDGQRKLLATWRGVADWVCLNLRPRNLFIGGRSLGGRIASHLVADGYPCQGLFLLSYPLHPPGKQEQQRKEHLARVHVPMFFLSGTRDSFASIEILTPMVRKIGAKLQVVTGADHGFKVPNRMGRSAKEIDEEVLNGLLDFFRSHYV